MEKCPKDFKIGGAAIECPYVVVMQVMGEIYQKTGICCGNSDQCIAWRKDYPGLRATPDPSATLENFRKEQQKHGSYNCKIWDVLCLDALDDERICRRPLSECEMWCKEEAKLKQERQNKRGRHIELEDEKLE